ncbi:RNA helicase [Sarracenia purpurea var. burkii]
MGRKHDETAMDITDNHETEAQKKIKNKVEARHKRKLEGTESEVVTEDKKEKRMKKKEKVGKGEDTLSNALVLDSAKESETLNGSDDTGKKKKKKKEKVGKGDDTMSNGLVLDSAKESGTLTGSDDTGKKKKKKKKKKHKEKIEVKNLNNGLVVDDADRREILNGSSQKSEEEEGKSCGDAVVSGKDVEESKYAALRSFAESGLPKEVLECCEKFDKPSPIQSHSWPFLLDGRDLIGIAATGSGKTLAFGIPAIMHVLQKRKGKTSKRVNPLCLVLSPTRELAQQAIKKL